jgi:hypothetical protein
MNNEISEMISQDTCFGDILNISPVRAIARIIQDVAVNLSFMNEDWQLEFTVKNLKNKLLQVRNSYVLINSTNTV